MDTTSDDQDDRARLRRSVWEDGPDSRPLAAVLERVCLVAVTELRLWGASVVVVPSESSHLVAAASGPAARELEEAQFTTGDGPTHAASRRSAPVLAPGVAGETLARWPGFGSLAARAGVRAAFSFPLGVGAARFGALSLYRADPGRLSGSELRCALVLVELAVEVLVDSTLPGHDGEARTTIHQALDGQAQVYQAQGMVMVQLGVGLSEALARMRAHAYAHDLTLAALATDIVEGRTRLVKE